MAAILSVGPAAPNAFGATDAGSAGPAGESATEFSRCMREQGLDDFPDAHVGENGLVQLDRDGSWVDPFSAGYLAALEECGGVLPDATTLPGRVEPPAPEPPSLPSFAAPEVPA
ncbi:hypothetical protein [Jiangella anatolica]|nr:hypothetical protein [Jiangella anatolica]